MEVIHAEGLDHRALNEALRNAGGTVAVEGCCGQRFLAAGSSGRDVTVHGIPGNALGAYLNGGTITVCGNAQDAVGDTMNAGTIVVRGSIGDGAGYAMRGGRIFVRGNAGYRAGIHMKAYRDKIPIMVIGGRAGSFLGEYQAGGIIVVLNLDEPEKPAVGDFPCTGMHGGKMFLRAGGDVKLPAQVTARPATEDDLAELRPILTDYAAAFSLDAERLLRDPFTVVTPDTRNPYRQMYVAN